MPLLGLLVSVFFFSPSAWASDGTPLASARALGDAFAEIVDRVGPATVYIQDWASVTAGGGYTLRSSNDTTIEYNDLDLFLHGTFTY